MAVTVNTGVFLRAAAEAFAIPLRQLVARPAPGSKGRHHGHRLEIRVRQVVQFIIRRKTRLSYPEIGRRLGYDHSTILHNHRVVANYIRRRDPEYIEVYRVLILLWVDLRQQELYHRGVVRSQVIKLLDNPTSIEGDEDGDVETDVAEGRCAIPDVLTQPHGEAATAA